ncbi:hypothetical protein E4O04_08990 [Treponema sp. OMZ 799]|uniref:hypothetical protein n=1 Tax=Treponema sp. OMZ 799 TaxID=2563668 RepID=UPI0020A48DF7|nr:hypothetical protein [Treponema sp. OMZ 799]UTC78127.1 hypothetical protein E4O04_08990 [Treponema sp. OMZ 799]
MRVKLDIVVVDNKTKYVCERRIKVKPIIRYYGDAPYMDMKATCPICEAVNVRADLAGGAGNDFNQCPVCGISLDWTDYLKEFKELRGKIEEALKKKEG